MQMTIEAFPNPLNAPDHGLIGVGGDFEPESLLLAYRSGIFPWPMPEEPRAWFCPGTRGVLEFKKLHIPKSLQKSLKKNTYSVSLNQNFEAVIRACAKVHKKREGGTWITKDLLNAYIELHRCGYAHSVETWDKDGALVGGIYGVGVDGYFSAESMFYTEPDASKFALVALTQLLQREGLEWVDIQMVTPHMKKWGAREIPRAQFLNWLQKSRLNHPSLAHSGRLFVAP